MDSRSILLVEDDPNDVELTERALRKNRIANEVIVASDGVEAMARLHEMAAAADEGAAMPALVLLDLKLPKMDGLEVLREIRADDRLKWLPVVILTSSLEQADLVRGYNLGCNAYVRKPVDFDQFAEAVRELGLFWLVLNERPPVLRG